jgi:hypothetical protein
MSYIKISDPNIIDLAAWHQVINVVNQLNDTVNALSNNTNITGTPNWNADDLTHQYDAGSQNILFGKTKLVQGTTLESTSHKLLYGYVTFASIAGVSSFAGAPIVTANILCGNTGSTTTYSEANDDAVVSVYNVSGTGFNYRVYRPALWNTTPLTPLYVCWIAIGPKG